VFSAIMADAGPMMTTASAGGPSSRSRRRLAWAVPVVVAGVVATGVAISTAGASSASPTLPHRSATQLLVAVQKSTATALSGEIHETVNLGVPTLPDARSSASLSWQSFLTGSHRARVWVAGADKQRVALIGELSEADVIHNGRDVWTYTSDTNTVSHTTLPQSTAVSARPSTADFTPAQAARRALDAVTPSTSVSVDSARMVAGRAAYTLVLRPRDGRSTVREVRIAVDASTFVPLQVQVFGPGSSAAFETGFTQISFATPSPTTFKFRVPAGASVTKDPFGLQSSDRHERHVATPGSATPGSASAEPHTGATSAPSVIGSGWTSVVELSSAAVGNGSGLGGGLLDQLTSTVGSSGLRLLHTTLINAVFLPDGRAFVGAVSPSLLEHIATTTPR
jgi:outer membrane lipoprotein-sorting protein